MKTSHVRKAKSATAELYTENDSTDHSVQTTYAPKQREAATEPYRFSTMYQQLL